MTDQDENPENLKTEYMTLSSYFNKLIGFRLTLLGFYVAAMALIITQRKQPLSFLVYFIGAFLTFSLYLYEIRTRILYTHLAKRGMKIEQELAFKEIDKEQPFFTQMFGQNKDKVQIRIFRWEISRSSKGGIFSHSFALDLLYVGMLIILFILGVWSLLIA